MEIEWTITNPNLSWINKVDGLDVTENYFDEPSALALLLNNEIVIINSLWFHRYNFDRSLVENPIPENLSKQISLSVICNDAFCPAADATDLEYNEIEDLYNHYIKDPVYGPSVWCMKKEKIPLMKGHIDKIRKQGIWNLDEIMSEWPQKTTI